MRRTTRILSRAGLGIVIVLALLIIASSLRVFGSQSFVVESGSMSPKVPTGSMVFDRTAASYKVGDVITFKEANSRDTVTHRIVSVNKDAAGQINYIVKGDANPAPDASPVAKSSVVGKVYLHVPYIGYLVGFFKTLFGLILFIIIPATIIIYRETGKIWEEARAIRFAKKRKPVPQTIKLSRIHAREKSAEAARKVAKGIIIAIVMAVIFAAPSTGAYSSDTSSLTGLTLTTGTWSS